APTRGDPPDLVGSNLRKPERAIWPVRDVGGKGVSGGKGKLRDHSTGRQPPNLIWQLSKPEVAIGPCHDGASSKGGRGERELGEGATRCHAPNPSGIREPEIAIRPYGNTSQSEKGLGQGEHGHCACGSDPPDLARSQARHGEPQVPIGSGRE